MFSNFRYFRCLGAVYRPPVNTNCVFRQSVRTFKQKPRGTENLKLVPVEAIQQPSNISVNKLVKPFLFTIGTTVLSFMGSSIWQYEGIRKIANEMRHPSQNHSTDKAFEFRRRLNEVWGEITRHKTPLVLFIATCNVGVWIAWRFSILNTVMTTLFLSSPFGRAPCMSMLLSAFSHHSFFHLAINMYVLNSLSQTLLSACGQEQTLAIYLAAGVVSSFTSYMHKVATASLVPSLGASGAIFGLLAVLCSAFPQAQLSIVGLNAIYPHSFSAADGLKGIMLLDVCGLVMGWRMLDHAAHLGGAVFGLWYFYYGHKYLWAKREGFIKQWHKLRGDVDK